MTDRETFVRAICADPADDTPRLVFADWLEEHGEPDRAEFVRVQVALANWPCECADDWERAYYDECRCKERGELRRRERELLDAHWRQWAPDLGIGGREVCTNLTGDDRPGVTFRRGFVAAVTCTAEDWLRVTDDVFWSPGQTVRYPACSSTGRVPAPAALPHPIEEVQLTTTNWPVWYRGETANMLITFGGDGTFIDPRWPGILFRTPGGTTAG